VVKYACASVMLFSVINLTRKLPNTLTQPPQLWSVAKDGKS
jgi:hypothetical protein